MLPCLKRWQTSSFGPNGWGGLFESHAVGRVRLKRTGCRVPYNTAETDGLRQGEGRPIQPCLYLKLPSFVTSDLSCTPVQMAGAHWLADAVHLFGIYIKLYLEGTGWNRCVFETNMWKEMCIWKGQVETNVCLEGTGWSGISSPTIQRKRLVLQCP